MKTVKENRSSILACVISLLLLVFFGGCTTLENLENETPPPEPINLAHPFTDVPVPKDSERDPSKTFVYESGSGAIKVGRLFFSTSENLIDTVEFYQNEMTNQGWTLVNSMAHDGKILNYQKEGSVCTVIIQSTWLGSDVEVQIGPK